VGARRFTARLFVHRATLLLVCWFGLSATGCASPGTPELEVLPEHFQLRPGEQIHYTVLERSGSGRPRFVDCRFASRDPGILRLIDPTGVFEAAEPGRTELVVRTPTSERRVTIEVAGPAQPPMMAVPHNTLSEIAAKELLFVGHANLDGFDHTAVAKPGIDRLVQEAKEERLARSLGQHGIPDWYVPIGSRTTRSSARDSEDRSASTPSG
jgi:hypothetical protein